MTRRLANPFSGLLTHLSLLASLGVLGVAMLANGDGGAGDGGDAGSGEGGDAGKGGAGGADDKGGKDDGKGDKPGTVTMTQTELDAMINKAHGKAKSQSEADFKKWLDAQAMTEKDRAKVEKEAAEKERDDAKAEAAQSRVDIAAERTALRAKVDPDRVDRFMRLLDTSADDLKTADGKPDQAAIDKAVAKTLEDFPEFLGAGDGKPTKKGGSSGGDHNGGNGGKTWTRAEIAKLTPAEYEKNQAEIDAQLKEGLIKV